MVRLFKAKTLGIPQTYTLGHPQLSSAQRAHVFDAIQLRAREPSVFVSFSMSFSIPICLDVDALTGCVSFYSQALMP